MGCDIWGKWVSERKKNTPWGDSAAQRVTRNASSLSRKAVAKFFAPTEPRNATTYVWASAE